MSTPVVSAPAMSRTAGGATAQRPAAERSARFALAKFRPTTLPTDAAHQACAAGRLEEGAGKRLTVVVGSAGAGKSVLLSSWAAAGRPG